MTTAERSLIDIGIAETIKSPIPFWKNLVAGTGGGVCLVFAGHPLDTLKARLQTMHVVPGQPPPFTGALDCFVQTVRKEGFLGLYKGVQSPLTGVSCLYAICFAAYGWGSSVQQKDPAIPLTMPQVFTAGVIAGIATTVVTAPMELVKLRLQIQRPLPGGEVRYKGALDCAYKVFQESGIRGIYRGTGATLLRDLPGTGAYFVAYETGKRYFSRDGSPASPFGTMVAGGMAGIVNWSLVLPADVIKSRIQTAPEGTYTGILDCARKMIAHEGPKALFKGFGPIMLRAFPANAACFLGFEASMKLLNKYC